MHEVVAKIVSREVADEIGTCWGLGSGTRHDPGPWHGELRNMYKPVAQENLWLQGGNLALSRFFSKFVALQIKARMEGHRYPGLQHAAVIDAIELTWTLIGRDKRSGLGRLLLRLPACEARHHQRAEDDRAVDRLDPEGRYLGERQEVLHDAEQQDAGQCAEHRALAAVERYAADDRRGENGEDHAVALVGADRADIAGDHEAADARRARRQAHRRPR